MALERTDSPKKYSTDPSNPTALFSRITKLLSSININYIPLSKEIVNYNLTYADKGFLSKKYVISIFPTYDYNGTRANNILNPTIFDWFNSNYDI